MSNFQRIDVRLAEKKHPLLLAAGITAQIGPELRRLGIPAGPAALVTSAHIAHLHGKRITQSLEAAGFRVVRCLISDDEPHKSLTTVAQLYEQFVAQGLFRQSPVLALGGGVIGDVAGFAAATYLRGVPLVLVPTTLLAMIDAAIGGKTAVNLPQGKNLIGAFKAPEVVFLDPNLLFSLPGRHFRAGFAEVVKHALIGDSALFCRLEQQALDQMDTLELIAAAVRVKIRIVEEDPLEMGTRMLLNLGHTFAHAFEQNSGYKLLHGEAVSVGLIAAARLSYHLGRCDPVLPARIAALLRRIGLPVRLPSVPLKEIRAAMFQDKKRIGTHLRFVIPLAVGQVILCDQVFTECIDRALWDIRTETWEAT